MLKELLVDDPCDGRGLLDQNALLKELGRYAELVGVLEKGAESCPERLDNLNNFAWALATLPDEELRDGPRAVAIMRKMMAASESSEPAHRDSLAAALAESGDFASALREATGVLADVRSAGGPKEVLAVLELHVEAFRAGQPIRDPAPEAP